MQHERTAVMSKKHTVTFKDDPSPDIDQDANFLRLFEQVVDYTLTSKASLYALYGAVNCIIDQKIPGAIVQCGVWRGGSALLAALILKERNIHDRPLYLYDTYEGMTPPTEVDVNKRGKSASEFMAEFSDEIGWTYATLDEVKATFAVHDFAFDIHFIKGDVVQTLQTEKPERIALLHLDTDWYESTWVELVHLYPCLERGGFLLIDDYGGWAGSRKATDEFFAQLPARPMLIRIDREVRMVVRP